MKLYTEVTFEQSFYSITVEHNGHEMIYVPREFGEVFSQTTKLGRYFRNFKTPQGAVKFLVRQGAIVIQQEGRSPNMKPLTSEQLDAVTIVIDEQTSEQFYVVQSATDPTITYQVRFNRTFSRWACQCKAMQQGITCWHLRAALEIGREHADNKRAEALAIARVEAEQAELFARVAQAKPYHPSARAEQRDMYRCQSRPFSLFR